MHPPRDDLPLSSIILRSYKICCNVCCVILAVHIMFFPCQKPSSSLSALKFCSRPPLITLFLISYPDRTVQL